jgi:mono/diheme cytochrome c family protein
LSARSAIVYTGLLLALVGLGGCMAVSQERPSGSYLYVNNCAACHGAFGEGDGPVAGAMRVTVPNLRTLRQRNDGLFPLDAVAAYIDGRDVLAAHGDRNMPVWGDVFAFTDDDRMSEQLAQERIDAVIGFLMELQYLD